MSIWLVILIVGVGTYLFRVSMLALVGRRAPSPLFERASKLVVPAAFSALAAGGITAAWANGGGGSVAVAPLGAAAVAGVAAHRTGSARVAILVGMPTLWVLNALAGA
jgi:branched-subunit amino acid transport protein